MLKIVVKHIELTGSDSYLRGIELAEIVKKNSCNLKTVAIVEKDGDTTIDALNYAWKKTNSIEMAWFKSEDITVSPTAQKRCRSTSIGDCFEIDGILYMADSYGFINLNTMKEV